MSNRRRSKLDRFSIGVLVVGFVLFLISAVCYTVTVILILTPAVEPMPTFTLPELGNIAGVLGMVVIPIFIVTSIIQDYRIRKREKQTGNDIDDDHPKLGAAGGSGPDQPHPRPRVHHGPSGDR